MALDVLQPGEPTSSGVPAGARVPKGHKMATVSVAPGAPVLKFGQIIGFATRPILPGDWVHEHNLAMGEDFARDYAFGEGVAPRHAPCPWPERATFQGFRRADGRAGTRNYLAILTSVNCSASVARFIAKEVERSGILARYPHIDGVIPLVHGTGCGMADKGEGFDALKRTQWGYATNPNIAGVLLVGLGCEVFQIGRMKSEYGLVESERFRTMTIQDEGGTRKTVESGVARLRRDAAGRRCGTARDHLGLRTRAGPAMRRVGRLFGHHRQPGARAAAVDLLVDQRRHRHPERDARDLRRRASADAPRRLNRAVGEKLVDTIHWWEAYTRRNGGEMNNNPSPGNKAGGLTTILEKSLGAAAKAGTRDLTAVYRYAERVTEHGFVFMDTPGYDPVSATGQVAGGANVLCFTTGRGSAYGCKPTPSIKLATNSDMARRMADDMDIDCGDVLEGVSVADKGREIFDRVLAVASGEPSKSEALGYGDAEFVPWQIGATM